MMCRDRRSLRAASFSRRLVREILCLLALLAALGLAPSAFATIRYQVSFSQPENHLFHVRMEIPNVVPGATIAMPAWNALYQIRDFAYRVRDVEVEKVSSAQRSAAQFSVARKLDKQDWSLAVPSGADVAAGAGADPEEVVTYAVAWDDPGPFSSQLNSHHAFINLAEILMYLPNRRDEKTEVQFDDVPSGWRIIAELPSGTAPDSFTAPSYDALVDAPVEAGSFDESEFDNDGAHFRVVVDTRDWDKRLLSDALRSITGYELHLMGGPPFSEYTFIFHIGAYSDVGGGGMEHMNSTAIAATSAGNAVAIAAHEFFHAWNVKRIRPQSLQPVDYSKEQYTRALWFAEGVTNTYASYTLERTHLWSKKQFYEDLASQIAALQSRPARKWQSAEESSLDAWFEKYDAYNLPSRSISYYDKGQILGVLLDLAIRDATDNHKSLDDVMRLMNDEYAKRGRYYEDSEGVQRAVEEVAGKSFADFFRRYVSGTDEIPYDQFFSVAGLQVKPGSEKDGGAAAEISELRHPTERQRRIREGLLRGTTE
jgi:predicted metalloprotease with PDZ domain